MSLLSGCCGKNNCCTPIKNNCCCTAAKSKCCCTTTTTAADTTVAGETTDTAVGPQEVRAMLQTVLDSCCTTADVCREITIDAPAIFDPNDFEVGDVIPLEIDGNIEFREVNREKDDCLCTSTVRFQIPIRLLNPNNCGCVNNALRRTITVIRSASLCCTRDSILMTPNTRVVAGSAVITDITDDTIRVAISLLFRSCLQQTLLREYTLTATPVCEYADCNDTRTLFTDPCDTICGCVSGTKSCPSC
ncbi:MAG: hypothetical protein Q4B96_01450 [Bacillota bacterium]|nr:hypothetical protein [Bacillota bacterium]